MKTQNIKAIFTNLLFVFGILLTIFGFVKGSLTAAKLITFAEYPLPSYEETRCQYEPYPASLVVEKVTPISDQDLEMRKEKCIASLDHQRKVQKTEDVVISVTTLLAGIVISRIFKR